MRYALTIAAALWASQASAQCLTNADVEHATDELRRVGIETGQIDDRAAITAFLNLTGWTGHVHAVVRLLFLFGRPEGNSMVLLVGERETCQRMSAPTQAMRAVYLAANGVAV